MHRGALAARLSALKLCLAAARAAAVDLAAEQGGNCELTEPGKDVVKHAVTICGPVNLPSTIPFHASQMYARTVTNFLLHLVKDGRVHLDLNDELTRGPLVTHEGQVVHEAVKTAGRGNG